MRVNIQYAGICHPKVYTEDQLAPNGDPLPGAIPRSNGPHSNLLLDSFYEAFLSGSTSRANLLQYVQASTETTAPAPGDTSVTPLGTGRLPYYSLAATASIVGNKIVQTAQYRGTKGQVQGTVGKLALFQNASGGAPMAASLVKDSGGSPTVLPLGANDYLYVDWIFETTIELTPATGVLTVPGEGDYNFELKPAVWNAANTLNSLACFSTFASRSTALGFNQLRAYSSNSLGAVTGLPSATGGAVDLLNSVPAAYVAGSKELDIEYYGTEADVNISGGIGSVALFHSSTVQGGWQISFAGCCNQLI
jgi:hypothetical protein